MSNDVLDENLRRLFARCAPRLTADDLDRALTRFEGRRRPASQPPRRRGLGGRRRKRENGGRDQ